MASAAGSGTSSSGAGGGISTSTRSPPASRAAAFRTAPSARTRPDAIVGGDGGDEGAEAGPVDQSPHGAAEEQADRAVIGPPAARQDPEGHLHQDHERADRQERHDPPPLGRDAREETEGEARV